MIEHKRAISAYEALKALVSSAAPREKEKLRTWAMDAPGRIRQCGLLQASAYYESDRNRKALYTLLSAWLMSDGKIPWQNSPQDLLPALYALSQNTQGVETYRVATREALAYSAWLKRAAESLIPVE